MSKDTAKLVAYAVGFLLLIGLVVMSVWLRRTMPCSAFENMRAEDVPVRCLTFVEHR